MKSKAVVARKTGVRGRPPLGSVPGREVLLAAAMTEFSRHGFEATSLRVLGARAGVDMALVARLFGSKADLYAAVIDRLAERLAAHKERLAAIAKESASDSAEAMRQFIRLFANISFEMPEFPAFLMQEVSNPGDRLEMLVERLIDPFREAVRPIVEAARDTGVVRVADYRLFFGMLIAAVSLPMLAPPVFSSQGRLNTQLRDEIAGQAIAMFVLSDSPHPRSAQPRAPRHS